MEAYFSLGSNLGDRRGNIILAAKKLDEALSAHWSRMSDIEESEAWGFGGGDFLDCIVVYDLPARQCFADEDAEALLDVCKKIEYEMGRREMIEIDCSGKRIYHDRIIDIDILFLGGRRIHTGRLTVPHPLISEREFILRPLGRVASQEIKSSFEEIFR